MWQVVVPVAVDITAYDESIEHDFRDPDYAMEFAELNGSEVT
jgi:hypothetical protein